MKELAKIDISTKAELSMLKDKLYLFADYLEFDKPLINQIIKSILEVGLNELFEENEFKIEISIDEVTENYYLNFKLFTARPHFYFDNIKAHFEKVNAITPSKNQKAYLQIAVLIDKLNFYQWP